MEQRYIEFFKKIIKGGAVKLEEAKDGFEISGIHGSNRFALRLRMSVPDGLQRIIFADNREIRIALKFDWVICEDAPVGADTARAIAKMAEDWKRNETNNQKKDGYNQIEALLAGDLNPMD